MGKNMPLEKFADGSITGTIWENRTKEEDDNRTFLVLRIEKRYRTREGEWMSGNNYTKADIKRLYAILRQAELFMAEHENKSRESATSY